MGGYGAFKFALQFPETFAGAASLSGAVDVAMRWETDRKRDKELNRILELRTLKRLQQ